MQNPAFQAYLRNKVLTATPEQLQLMLYEGAIRFAQLARLALEEKDYERAQDAFERADAVIAELIAGLRPELDGELCDRFASLYLFCSRRLTEANFRHSIPLVDDAIRILHHLRETWVQVLDRLALDRSESALTDSSESTPDSSSLRVET